MVQRVQTIYLMLTAIIAVILLTVQIPYFELVDPNGGAEKGVELGFTRTISYDGTNELKSEENTPLTIFIITLLIVSIVAIFCFKNRKLQRILCLVGFSVVLAFYAMLAYNISNLGRTYPTKEISWGIFIAVLFPFLFIAAYKAIRRDEALLRSANSIR